MSTYLQGNYDNIDGYVSKENSYNFNLKNTSKSYKQALDQSDQINCNFDQLEARIKGTSQIRQTDEFASQIEQNKENISLIRKDSLDTVLTDTTLAHIKVHPNDIVKNGKNPDDLFTVKIRANKKNLEVIRNNANRILGQNQKVKGRRCPNNYLGKSYVIFETSLGVDNRVKKLHNQIVW